MDNTILNSIGNSAFTIFIVLALMLGGAGQHYPVLNMVIELAAVFILLVAAVRLAPARMGALHWSAIALLAAAFGMILLQLVPMPWDRWLSDPTRAAQATIWSAADLRGGATPLSLTPDATWLKVLALLPLAAAYLGGLACERHARSVLRAVIGVAVISTILAALQIAGGADSVLYPFVTDHRGLGLGLGLFVNRNHQAMFLLAAMPLVVVPDVIMGPSKRSGRLPEQWVPAVALIVMLALGVLGTASRSGLIILPFALGACAVIAIGRWQGKVRHLVVIPVLMLVGVAAFFAPVTQTVVGRFATAADDTRFQYWANTIYAAEHALPFGTGFGSFPKIYPIVEPLDEVGPLVVGHAHNDYLELLLEGGIPAVCLFLIFAVLVGVCAWRGIRQKESSGRRARTLAGSVVIIIFLAASVTDYPLRMPANAVLFGLALALIMPPVRRPVEEVLRSSTGRYARLAGGGVAAILALYMGAQAIIAGWGYHVLLAGRAEEAVRWMPWSGEAWAVAATKRQIADDVAGTEDAAGRAVSIVAIDQAAARALGFAMAARGDTRSNALLVQGGVLGWRDGLLQLWLAQRAVDTGQPVVAVQRIDALLRARHATPEIFAQLSGLIEQPGFAAALADEMAQRPRWRRPFIDNLAAHIATRSAAAITLTSALRRTDAPLAPAELQVLLAAYLRVNDRMGAQELLKTAGDSGAFRNSGFDGDTGVLPATFRPFVWRAVPVFGVAVSITVPVAPWKGNAASILSDGTASGVALAQAAMVRAGRYRLSFVASSDPWRSEPVSWQIDCRHSGGGVLPIAVSWRRLNDKWWAADGVFDVPDTACDIQDLQAVIGSGAGAASIWVDSVSVAPMH